MEVKTDEHKFKSNSRSPLGDDDNGGYDSPPRESEGTFPGSFCSENDNFSSPSLTTESNCNFPQTMTPVYLYLHRQNNSATKNVNGQHEQQKGPTTFTTRTNNRENEFRIPPLPPPFALHQPGLEVVSDIFHPRPTAGFAFSGQSSSSNFLINAPNHVQVEHMTGEHYPHHQHNNNNRDASLSLHMQVRCLQETLALFNQWSSSQSQSNIATRGDMFQSYMLDQLRTTQLMILSNNNSPSSNNRGAIINNSDDLWKPNHRDDENIKAHPPVLAGCNNHQYSQHHHLGIVSPAVRRRRRDKIIPHNNSQQEHIFVDKTHPSSQQQNEAAQQQGDMILEEFRRGRKRFHISELVCSLSAFAQDQFGSRHIQQRIGTSSDQDNELLFKAVLVDCRRLTTDVFGNYVIQKFFDHGTPLQKEALADQLVGEVVRLSMQMYGCRVVQKALESITLDKQIQLVKEIEGHVIRCVEDQNGNHVIQKCIESIPEEHIHFIVDAFAGQIFRMAVHCYGCRVIQRLLENCSHGHTGPLLDEILLHTHSLAQNQYGNYVVQHVIEFGREADKETVLRYVRDEIRVLSTHKFASNVVEKSIQFTDSNRRREIIAATLTGGSSSDGSAPLLAMMKDRYANYVVQKMLQVSEATQKAYLVQCLLANAHALKKFSYGKHIITALERVSAIAENSGHQNSNRAIN